MRSPLGPKSNTVLAASLSTVRLMPTVMGLLRTHASICAECLTRQTQARSDVVYSELDRLKLIPKEDRCAICAEVTPVFSAR